MDNRNKDPKEKRKNTPASLIFLLKQNDVLAKITLGLLVLIVLVSIFGVMSALGNKIPELNDEDLALSIKPMGNLTTVQVKVAKIGVEAEMKTGLCTFGSDYLINGIIEAGIDLSGFSASNISMNVDTGVYQLSVPEPQLTRCEFKTERYHDRKSVTCAGIDYRDLNTVARYVASTGIIEDTLKAGIVDRSKRETSVLIESLVKTLTGKSVDIAFVLRDEELQLPPSCDLEPPKQFTQGDDGTWRK